MAKYTQAVLHANGETLTFPTAEDAKNFRNMFKVMWQKSADGKTEWGYTPDASLFAVLTIDDTKTPLAPKPQCDNYCGCCSSCSSSGSDSDSDSSSDSDSQSDSTTDSDSVSDSESEG